MRDHISSSTFRIHYPSSSHLSLAQAQKLIHIHNRFHAEEKPNSISTYRGSIQLHASSWPKTDLSPLKSLRSDLEVERVDAVRLLVAMQSMISSPTNAGPITDKLFHCPAFWDYGKEIFLDQLNKLIVAGHPQLMAAGMKVMTRRELDDIVEWMVHWGRFLT